MLFDNLGTHEETFFYYKVRRRYMPGRNHSTHVRLQNGSLRLVLSSSHFPLVSVLFVLYPLLMVQQLTLVSNLSSCRLLLSRVALSSIAVLLDL